MTSLDSVPQEVLEHIAFFVATDVFLGPPSNLVPLLASSRRIYSRLSISSNPHLYARIFTSKFDLQPALKRLGSESISPAVLSAELKERFICLKRIRTRTDAYSTKGSGRSQDTLHQLLLRLYIWLLESEEKNELQLREYARIDSWIHEYWFNYDGASNAMYLIQDDKWPINDRSAALAMWLYWLLLRPDEYNPDDNVLDVLRAFAMAAHKYNLATPSWTEFLPSRNANPPTLINHFNKDFELTPLPVSIPAILSFLTLVNKSSSPLPVPHPSSSLKSMVRIKPSSEWDCEWARCLSLSQPEHDGILSEVFKPGSIEGVWEGQFTYTEFTAYAALLGGAQPHVLQKSVVARHQQTWKLREYHFTAPDASNSDSGIDLDIDLNVDPIPPGDPLRAYFPNGTHIKEGRDGLIIHTPHRSGSVRYERALRVASQLPEGKEGMKVVDVIIMGEGHSSWGQFNLVGRVRPCDGFISLSKEYIDGDRGRWVYRGYLVGNAYGNLAGRWRDTLSPPDVPGYEGCFAMSRRR